MSFKVNVDSSATTRAGATGAAIDARPEPTSAPAAIPPAKGFARSWSVDAVTTWALARRWLPMVIAVLPIAGLRYLKQNCIQWAGSLAYYTLLGIVPLLAVVFSALTVAGLHRELAPFVMNTIGAGSPEIATQIVDFIDQTNVRAVAVFSLLGAFLALLAIMANAELCFNMIWGGIPGRSLRRKMHSFAKVAVIAPLMLLLAFAFTAFLRPGSRLYGVLDSWYLGDAALALLPLVPFALLWGSFTLLYTGLPNTRVRRRSAIVGAVVAGILWLMAQWAYVTFLIGMVRYSAVYGTLWQIPILLAWIYIAWSIILFGAQVSRAHQEVVQIRRVMARAREAG
jgi:membrane protein